MRQDDVNAESILRAVRELRTPFQTKDVSNRHNVRVAHASVVGDRNFHAIIGSYLSRNAHLLGLRSVGRLAPKGEMWDRTRDAQQRLPPVANQRLDLAVGPQHPGDTPFAQRMRLHQSWYRAHVLKAACGTGPGPKDTGTLGNMLDRSSAGRGANFLNARIALAATERLGLGGVDAYKCLHNMLSSQVMCMNLFGMMVADTEFATRVLSAWLPDTVGAVTRVLLEHAPQPRGQYLGDRTSFDAFVEYRTMSGELAFLGIETKLAESFSPNPYDSPRYRELTEREPYSPWLAEAWPELHDGRWNQLWRNHLLVHAMLAHPTSMYERGSLVLIHHRADTLCAETATNYRGFLSAPDTFLEWTLDWLLAVAAPDLRSDEERAWVAAFNNRYVDLQASEYLVRPARSRPHGPAVRGGHWRAIELLGQTAAARETLSRYERKLGHSVYLRPTERGLTVISLDADRCRSMVGVSDRDNQYTYLKQLPATEADVTAACAGYVAKRDSLRRSSEEERFAIRCIRHALSHELELPHPGWFFLHQEWRFPAGGKLDLLAVDAANERLVVIELKDTEANLRRPDASGRIAIHQAASYAALLFQDRATLVPFLQQLARTQAVLYGAPVGMQLVNLKIDEPPIADVWWPEKFRDIQ